MGIELERVGKECLFGQRYSIVTHDALQYTQWSKTGRLENCVEYFVGCPLQIYLSLSMPSGRQRTSANAPDASTVTLNEKILKECHDLYTEKDRGRLFIK